MRQAAEQTFTQLPWLLRRLFPMLCVVDLPVRPWRQLVATHSSSLPALPCIDPHRLVVEIEQRSVAVPDGAVLVARHDPPGSFGLRKAGQSQGKVDQPVAGSVLAVLPVSWEAPTVVYPPVAALEVLRILAVRETLSPPTVRELFEVPDQYRIQLLVLSRACSGTIISDTPEPGFSGVHGPALMVVRNSNDKYGRVN